jgi:hypothetical protein
VPDGDEAIRTFQRLAEAVGPDRVIWRYDPIVLCQEMDAGFHLDRFSTIAEQLCGYTRLAVVSFVDRYRHGVRRLAMAGINAEFDRPVAALSRLLPGLVCAATESRMEVRSCAEELDLTSFGVVPGRCIDDDYIRRVFGIDVAGEADPGQRKACNCVVSKDIGMYETCVLGCQYCYATRSFDAARRRYVNHDPTSPSLAIGFQGQGAGGEVSSAAR